jgi:hypothetical protein
MESPLAVSLTEIEKAADLLIDQCGLSDEDIGVTFEADTGEIVLTTPDDSNGTIRIHPGRDDVTLSRQFFEDLELRP